MNKKIKALSFFSGAMGMDIGLFLINLLYFRDKNIRTMYFIGKCHFPLLNF
jgi:hypothetical protein